MLFYTIFIVFIVVILSTLIGFYYFSKQQYNNFFVSLLLDEDKLKQLKVNNINQEEYKKINFILKIRIILLIVLSSTAVYFFKVHNLGITYLILILLFLLRFISNKHIEQIFFKLELLYMVHIKCNLNKHHYHYQLYSLPKQLELQIKLLASSTKASQRPPGVINKLLTICFALHLIIEKLCLLEFHC